MDIIFFIVVVIMSAVIHEFSHGYAAFLLGDPTAKLQGRLTLNPIPHLDLMGSIIVPFLLALLPGGIILAWAKPVPFNPYNLSNQKWGPAMVAGAGPLANIIIAIVFGLVIRFAGILSLPFAFVQVIGVIVFINILLAIFNLIPIPPLDGSKILFTFFPYRWIRIQEMLEQYGFFLVIIFIIFFWEFISPILLWLFSFITNVSLLNFF